MSSSSSSSPEISVANTTDTVPERFSYKLATFDEAIEELTSRFILNLPDEELESPERICFQVEQAHWFYEDFIREQNPKFPSFPLKKFSAILFEACPLLHRWAHDHEQAFEHFMLYKTRVPVCGAIMLNESWDKCILVKGWKSSSGWGFPKGKINEDEPAVNCAIREVLEETGYNLAGKVNPSDKIEMTIKEQRVILYIVPGVPEDYPFKTKTRKEISKIEWFKLPDLPTWKRSKAVPGKFYLISPFIGSLKAFIHDRKPRNLPRKGSKQTPLVNVRIPQTLVTQASFSSLNDSNQESSSQSSSADAGEPPTPSPQYTESVVQQVNSTVHVNGSNAVETETMDPHFARLLSSLALSGAGKSGATQQSLPLPPSTQPSQQRPPARGTPVPEPSISSPESSSEKASLRNHPAKRATSASIRLSPSVPSFSRPLAPIMTNGDTPSSSLSPLSLMSIPNSVSTHPTSPISSRKLTSRRTSSTADISPYLSKPPEVPTSAKHLRQLALLEAVADESARMTPFVSRAEPSMVAMGKAYPLPPSSVPPHVSQDPTDPRVIYTSHGGTIPQSSHDTTRSMFPPHDPFQVRPRTSHSMHRPSYPTTSSLSMNQHQLLALINPPLPPPLPSQVPQPPTQPHYGTILHMPPPPHGPYHSFPSMHPGLTPIYTSNPLQPLPRGHASPMSAPALTPRFDLPGPPVNQTLLSILNARGGPNAMSSNIPT